MAKTRKMGRAQVELGVDDSPLVKGLKFAQKTIKAWAAGVNRISQAATAGLSRIGGGLRAAGQQIQATGSMMIRWATGLAAPFGFAIKAASDLQETTSKFDTVFGENADAVKAWGDQFSETIGRSKKDVRNFLGGTQDLLVPLGMDPNEAVAMSKAITALAVDLASFNNMADEDVIRDFHAALTGSGVVMKKYGVIVSEAATKQELLNRGIDPKKATEAQKAQARFGIILNGTTAAHGDAIRTSDSFANQLKKLKARIANAAATAGTALLPVMSKLVERIGDGVNRVSKFIEENQGLVLAGLKAVGVLGAIGAALFVLGPLISGIGLAFSAMGAALSLALSPVGLMTAGIATLGTVIVRETGQSEAVLGAFGEAWGTLKADAMNAWDGIKAALQSGDLSQALEVAGAAMKVAWASALLGMKTLWLDLKTFLMDVWANTITNLAKGITVLVGAFRKAVATIQNVWLETQKTISQKLFDAAGQDGVLGDAARLVVGQDLRNVDQDIRDQDRAALGAGFDSRKADTSAIDAQTSEALSSLDAQNETDRQNRLAAAQSSLAESQKELTESRKRMEAAIAEAKKNAEATGEGDAKSKVANALEEFQANQGSGGNAGGAGKSTAVGTFSAAAVRGFAQGTSAERTAKATEETAKNTKRISQAAQTGGLKFT